jgi:dTDP-4-dehydrorhamnose 3,5-epimerase
MFDGANQHYSLSTTMTCLPEVQALPRFQDTRGWFMPLWCAAGDSEGITWAQDNVSFSRGGVIRGLHFQHPNGQAKLLTVLQGEIFDVAVDVRRGSPDFGRAFTSILRGEDASQIKIPAGFAHGFAVLSKSALVHYRCSVPWSPADEKTLLWSDPAMAIDWPLDLPPVLSKKDANGRRLGDFAAEELPALET